VIAGGQQALLELLDDGVLLVHALHRGRAPRRCTGGALSEHATHGDDRRRMRCSALDHRGRMRWMSSSGQRAERITAVLGCSSLRCTVSGRGHERGDAVQRSACGRGSPGCAGGGRGRSAALIRQADMTWLSVPRCWWATMCRVLPPRVVADASGMGARRFAAEVIRHP
jgi:hypothetical protein